MREWDEKAKDPSIQTISNIKYVNIATSLVNDKN